MTPEQVAEAQALSTELWDTIEQRRRELVETAIKLREELRRRSMSPPDQ